MIEVLVACLTGLGFLGLATAATIATLAWPRHHREAETIKRRLRGG